MYSISITYLFSFVQNNHTLKYKGKIRNYTALVQVQNQKSINSEQ